MSRSMKSNITHTIMWGIAAIVMIIIFASEGTIANWGDNRTKTVLLAFLFFAGFAVDFAIWIYDRAQSIKKDERDYKVQSESVSKSFVVLVAYIYAVSIGLYIKYENIGTVPVGWIWFIAYSVIIAANLLVGIFSIIGYKKQGL